MASAATHQDRWAPKAHRSGPSLGALVLARVLYLAAPPQGSHPSSPEPVGALSRRVITQWAPTGKDLKVRGRPTWNAIRL